MNDEAVMEEEMAEETAEQAPEESGVTYGVAGKLNAQNQINIPGDPKAKLNIPTKNNTGGYVRLQKPVELPDGTTRSLTAKEMEEIKEKSPAWKDWEKKDECLFFKINPTSAEGAEASQTEAEVKSPKLTESDQKAVAEIKDLVEQEAKSLIEAAKLDAQEEAATIITQAKTEAAELLDAAQAEGERQAADLLGAAQAKLAGMEEAAEKGKGMLAEITEAAEAVKESLAGLEGIKALANEVKTLLGLKDEVTGFQGVLVEVKKEIAKLKKTTEKE